MTDQLNLFGGDSGPVKPTAEQARQAEAARRQHPAPGYYNTTRIRGETLQEIRESTEDQQRAIAHWYRVHADHNYTPWEVAEHFRQWPITSIRRAITNLQKAGILTKTKAQRIGPFGRPSYAWQHNGARTKQAAKD